MYSLNLTTTSSRLNLCSATVWSLVNQSFTPDNITIWISQEPYMSDDGITESPVWIEQFNKIKNIVRVRYVENTGPYRKIIPALREANGDDILIYADDDVIYANLWLETLINKYHKYNGENVIASRVRCKSKNIFGNYKSYHLFHLSNMESSFSHNFIITGVGGCILAKKHIRQDLIEIDDYIKIAPKTDDLWISKLIELSKTELTSAPEAMCYVQEICHSNNALSHQNVVSHIHDTFLGRLSLKIYHRFMGYLGFSLSNNDKSMKKIDDYFKNK